MGAIAARSAPAVSVALRVPPTAGPGLLEHEPACAAPCASSTEQIFAPMADVSARPVTRDGRPVCARLPGDAIHGVMRFVLLPLIAVIAGVGCSHARVRAEAEPTLRCDANDISIEERKAEQGTWIARGCGRMAI